MHLVILLHTATPRKRSRSVRMDLERQLVGIERRLWTHDAAFYEDSLVDWAVLIFAETGIITRAAAVTAILQENRDWRRWAEVHRDNTRCLPVSASAALLPYRVTGRWAHMTRNRSQPSPAAFMSAATAGGSWPSISRRQFMRRCLIRSRMRRRCCSWIRALPFQAKALTTASGELWGRAVSDR
jgi:hypothetical protein